MFSRTYLLFTGLFLLLTFVILASLPTTHSKYAELNGRCGVYFNTTQLVGDTWDSFYLKQMLLFGKCRNNTISIERNLTSGEKDNCHAKCFQIGHGFANENGTFDTKFLERTRDEYTKYSNASASFINNLVNIFSNCTSKVAETYESLQKTEQSECGMTGLYKKCFSKLSWMKCTSERKKRFVEFNRGFN